MLPNLTPCPGVVTAPTQSSSFQSAPHPSHFSRAWGQKDHTADSMWSPGLYLGRYRVSAVCLTGTVQGFVTVQFSPTCRGERGAERRRTLWGVLSSREKALQGVDTLLPKKAHVLCTHRG